MRKKPHSPALAVYDHHDGASGGVAPRLVAEPKKSLVGLWPRKPSIPFEVSVVDHDGTRCNPAKRAFNARVQVRIRAIPVSLSGRPLSTDPKLLTRDGLYNL